MIRVALITNLPPPYRIPIYNILAKDTQLEFHAIFFSLREPNRSWDLPPIECHHYFLQERFINYHGRYIHFNPDIIGLLNKISPDVIINDGFNPTHLLSFLYAVINKIPHIPMTDGTDLSEKNFSFLHKFIRKIIYKRSASFISAALGGKRLYASYGIPKESCFLSCLCIDNEKFQSNQLSTTKIFDFIFCSRLEKEKNPEFAVQVALLTASRLGKKCRLLFVGSGSLEASLKILATQYRDSLEIVFHGFATQSELPALYCSAKLFLFPTQADVWGIVVNEACAAGLPIITTPYAGVVNELVMNNKNGYVRDLNVHTWVNCTTELLINPKLYSNFSQHSLSLVAPYNFTTASDGIKRAIFYALKNSKFSSRLMNSSVTIKRIE